MSKVSAEKIHSWIALNWPKHLNLASPTKELMESLPAAYRDDKLDKWFSERWPRRVKNDMLNDRQKKEITQIFRASVNRAIEDKIKCGILIRHE